jgi:hypothetical protein
LKERKFRRAANIGLHAKKSEHRRYSEGRRAESRPAAFPEHEADKGERDAGGADACVVRSDMLRQEGDR